MCLGVCALLCFDLQRSLHIYMYTFTYISSVSYIIYACVPCFICKFYAHCCKINSQSGKFQACNTYKCRNRIYTHIYTHTISMAILMQIRRLIFNRKLIQESKWQQPPSIFIQAFYRCFQI